MNTNRSLTRPRASLFRSLNNPDGKNQTKGVPRNLKPNVNKENLNPNLSSKTIKPISKLTKLTKMAKMAKITKISKKNKLSNPKRRPRVIQNKSKIDVDRLINNKSRFGTHSNSFKQAISSFQEENKQLEFSLEDEKCKSELMKTKLENQNKDIKEKENEIKTLEEKINSLDKKRDSQKENFEGREEALKKHLRMRINEIKELKLEKIELIKKLEEKENKIKNKNEESIKKENLLLMKISNLEERITLMEEKIQYNKDEVKKEKEESEKLKSLLNNSKSETKALLEEKEKEKQKDLGEKERELAEKEAFIKEKEKENKNLNMKIKDLKEIVKKKDEELERMDSMSREICNELVIVKKEKEEKDKLLATTGGEVQAQLALAAVREKETIKLKENKALLEKKLKEMALKLEKDEERRRKLHNQVLELKGNIRVFCRVRPFIGADFSAKESMPHKTFLFPEDCDGRKITAVGPERKNVTGQKTEGKTWSFTFDRVFRHCDHQDAIFKEISQLVQSAVDGYKVCIFAYGQTGSGKTYTMEGPKPDEINQNPMENPKDFNFSNSGNDINCYREEAQVKGECNNINKGMIDLSIGKIFECIDKLKEKKWEFKCRAMFLEIYNEELRDLLENSVKLQKKLEIKHFDKPVRTVVENLKYVPVESPSDIVPLLRLAKKNRAVGATKSNERSSRSHSVFQLELSGRHKSSGISTNGLLNLVDLAGSERLTKSGSHGDRLREARHINRSLSALGNVITALNNKERHVPFRNSKLTYLLKNSFGGDCKTLMFVNLSPDVNEINESVNSLRFAQKVNSCVIGTARKNLVVRN